MVFPFRKKKNSTDEPQLRRRKLFGKSSAKKLDAATAATGDTTPPIATPSPPPDILRTLKITGNNGDDFEIVTAENEGYVPRTLFRETHGPVDLDSTPPIIEGSTYTVTQGRDNNDNDDATMNTFDRFMKEDNADADTVGGASMPSAIAGAKDESFLTDEEIGENVAVEAQLVELSLDEPESLASIKEMSTEQIEKPKVPKVERPAENKVDNVNKMKSIVDSIENETMVEEEQDPGKNTTLVDSKVDTTTKLTVDSDLTGSKPPTPAERIMNYFQCGKVSLVDDSCKNVNSMNLFYDKVCTEQEKKLTRRPFFDEEFTVKFLRDIVNKGVSLLYHQAPGSPGNVTDEWKGRSVNMMLEPGTHGDSFAIQPKLKWSTLPGGQHTRRQIIALSLLKIHSISTNDVREIDSGESKEDIENEDMCFFTVTTDQGDVHVFETSSTEQRDIISNGLKNVIARLVFQLIAGDAQASSELHTTQPKEAVPGELPSLANPHQNMNRISHILLD